MSNQNTNCNDQNHVHELVGSTAIVNDCNDCHNHRFCTVTDEAVRIGNSHYHEVKFRTDFTDEHYHEFCGRTTPAIEVGNGKHVHFIKDVTITENGHVHKLQAATLIDSPTDFNNYK